MNPAGCIIIILRHETDFCLIDVVTRNTTFVELFFEEISFSPKILVLEVSQHDTVPVLSIPLSDIPSLSATIPSQC